ncbi:SH3 domain-containing protein [Eubacteriales bacterium OttesenSCG-928-K08]|nr:SH3 domain-containing protein [Eubacteriales bacterium OttesenSCG-928-K08]
MAKRIISLFMLTAFLFGVASGALAASSNIGQVTAQDVNLRKEPNTDADILAALPLNTELEILEESGDWYRVLYGDKVGYVSSRYLFVNSMGSRAAYVLQDGVKLLGGPGDFSYVVAELKGSQGVKIKFMVGDWYFVVAGDQVGYVDRRYLTMTKGTNAAGNQLKTGMEGQEVLRMQTELHERLFLAKADVTGTFGAKTRKAVAEFQEANGIEADGVAGAVTLDLLYDVNNKVTKTIAMASQVKGNVELFDWFKGGADWLAKGSQYLIIDVRTGLSFTARRFGGWYHADSVPLTAADTATFKKIVNGKWTWDRRAIWISYRGRVVAGSMNCMPHLSSPIKTNNFPGHFCVHLYKSKVHENSKECPRHQAAVQEAYRKGK